MRKDSTSQPSFARHVKRGAAIGAITGAALGAGSIAWACLEGSCTNENVAKLPRALVFGTVFGGVFGVQVGMVVYLAKRALMAIR